MHSTSLWRAPISNRPSPVSHDLGETWSAPRTAARATRRRRYPTVPYSELCSDGAGRIDFVFTEATRATNPRTASIISAIRRARILKRRHPPRRPGRPCALDPPPAATGFTTAPATAAPGSGDHLQRVDAARPSPSTRLPAENYHRYEFARWDGQTWRVTEICPPAELVPAGHAGKSGNPSRTIRPACRSITPIPSRSTTGAAHRRGLRNRALAQHGRRQHVDEPAPHLPLAPRPTSAPRRARPPPPAPRRPRG